MRFEIKWSSFSEIQLDKIYDYYLENVSYKVAGNLIQGILYKPNILIEKPFIGQAEPYLQERNVSYRYIIYKNYKIIYSVDEENGLINIADVFDTRQNPVKISRKK